LHKFKNKLPTLIRQFILTEKELIWFVNHSKVYCNWLIYNCRFNNLLIVLSRLLHCGVSSSGCSLDIIVNAVCLSISRINWDIIIIKQVRHLLQIYVSLILAMSSCLGGVRHGIVDIKLKFRHLEHKTRTKKVKFDTGSSNDFDFVILT
jgi:hypothetical protein